MFRDPKYNCITKTLFYILGSKMAFFEYAWAENLITMKSISEYSKLTETFIKKIR